MERVYVESSSFGGVIDGGWESGHMAISLLRIYVNPDGLECLTYYIRGGDVFESGLCDVFCFRLSISAIVEFTP